MRASEDPSLVRNIGLFVLLVVLINGLILPGPASSMELLATFYLASFFHAGFTLYDGSFNALRTATWVLLIAGWAGTEIGDFFGYMLPWGQLSFWASAWLTNLLAALPAIGERLAEWCARNCGGIGEAAIPSPILFLLFLCLDAAVMHREAWRKSSPIRIAIFLAAASAGALLFGLAAGALASLTGEPVPSAHDMADIGALPTPPKIVPNWYELPFYALLRAIPNKLAGVTLVFAAMAIPLIWPWMGADVLRKGSTHLVWLSLCLSQAAIWIGLGYLGSRPPEPPVIQATQMLAVLYFAFFLVWPPLLRKLALNRALDRHR